MPTPRRPLPPELAGREFTVQEADAAGLTPRQRRGPAVVRVRRGVYRYADTAPSLTSRLRTALRSLPQDTVVSHLSALSLWGVAFLRTDRLHLSTSTDAQTRHPDVVLHRRDHRLRPLVQDGLPCLGVERSFVDAATILGVRDLVRAGDQLVRAGRTDLGRLLDFVVGCHLDGVVRARVAATLVRERVDSIRETDTRLVIVTSGLPEPECNVPILAPDGTWLARGDLVYAALKIIVEFDGWHHERDAVQRQKDLERRERLEAAGWSVIVVTSADLAHPTSVVARVYETLVRRGYRGPSPDLGRRWHQIVRGL